MTARRARLKITGELPPAPTILGAYEAEATDAARRVSNRTARTARTLFPGGRNRTRRQIRGSVTRTPQGLAITVRVRGGREYIARFVEAGTGELGPRGRRIPARKRGRLPHGAVPTGRGQAPQRVFDRVRAAESDQAVRELTEAAGAAARRIFR